MSDSSQKTVDRANPAPTADRPTDAATGGAEAATSGAGFAGRPPSQTEAEMPAHSARPSVLQRAAYSLGYTWKAMPHQGGLMIALALNLFLIIVVCLVIATGIGWLAASSGWLTSDFLTNPAVLTALVVMLSLLLTFAVFAMTNALVLRPLHNMLGALSELAQGNFGVRVKSDEGVSIREIDQFVDSFNATARELESVEVLRSGFIDDFSHEFKTPIASISGFAQLMLDDAATDEDRRAWATIIAQESKRLAGLSGDILMLRQVESQGQLSQADLVPVDIGEQIRRAAILMQEKWADKNLDLQLDVRDVACPGSPALLERVWVNLVDNACKFSPEEAVVNVSLRRDGTAALVRVENDGPTIAPDAQARLFERFYQAEASHTTQGCGLGLPLVKSIVELHGGRVSAKSDPTGHTTFTASLPACI